MRTRTRPRLYTQVYARDFTGQITPAARYSVQRYSCSAIGGPDMAEIRIDGPVQTLWRFANLLGAGLRIYDDAHDMPWHGLIAEFEISVPGQFGRGYRLGLSLRDMFNRVKVVYPRMAGTQAGTVRADTDWAELAASTGSYGDKEKQLSGPDAPQVQAEQYRDAYLAQVGLPVPVISEYDGADCFAVVRGWGHWRATEWQYEQELGDREEYNPKGGVDYELGKNNTCQMIAQSFQLSGGAVTWLAAEVQVKLGAPFGLGAAGTVYVDLCANTGAGVGAPSTVLETGSIAESSIGADISYRPFRLASRVALSAATKYWLKLRRSAVNDPGLYVRGVEPGSGYANGDCRTYNADAAAWQGAAGDADLKFRVLGERQSTSVIGDIVTAACQFLTGTLIENTSGVYVSPLRSGDKTAQAELLALLEHGTTSDRRLLCDVLPSRVLRVWEEPAQTSGVYRMYPGQVLHDPYDNPVAPHRCMCGVWAKHINVIPTAVDLDAIADPRPFFIESAEYDAGTGRTQYTPRAVDDPLTWLGSASALGSRLATDDARDLHRNLTAIKPYVLGWLGQSLDAATGMGEDNGEQTSIAPQHETVVTFTGTIGVTVGTLPIENRLEGTQVITSVSLRVGTAPVDAAIIVDVNLDNGSGAASIFAAGDRPQIAASATSGSSGKITTPRWLVGGALYVDIDQVGSTAAGADLTVTITHRGV